VPTTQSVEVILQYPASSRNNVKRCVAEKRAAAVKYAEMMTRRWWSGGGTQVSNWRSVMLIDRSLSRCRPAAALINGLPDSTHSFVHPVGPLGGGKAIGTRRDDLWRQQQRPRPHTSAPPLGARLRDGRSSACGHCAGVSFGTPGTDESAAGRRRARRVRPVFYCVCRHCCCQSVRWCIDGRRHRYVARRFIVVVVVVSCRGRSWFCRRGLTPSVRPTAHTRCSI